MNLTHTCTIALLAAAGGLTTLSTTGLACPSSCEAEKDTAAVQEAAQLLQIAHDEHDHEHNHQEVVIVHDDEEIKAVYEDGVYKIYVDGDVVAKGEAGQAEWMELLHEHLGDMGDHGAWFDGEHKIMLELGDEGADVQRLMRHLHGQAGGDAAEALALLKLVDEEGNHVADSVIEINTSRPPVMLGITMESVNADLAEHFEIDGEVATMIGSVLEGLPAERAGLRARDIVIRIDGERDASQDGIRRVLSEKSPGETIRMKILRAGQPKTIKVKLDAFSADALGMENDFEMDEQIEWGFPEGQFNIEIDDDHMADLFATLQDRLTAEQYQEIEEHLSKLKESMGQMRGGVYGLHFGDGEDNQFFVPTIPDNFMSKNGNTFRFYTDGDTDETILVPRRGGFAYGPGADADDRLEERLERIEERVEDRLDRIEDRIESRLDRIEEMIEHLIDRSH